MVFQFPAGLESGSGGQVGAGVALHMRQTALDPGAGPRLQARRLRAAQPVGDQHIGRGDPGEQGQVGGLGLVRAPLEGEDFAASPSMAMIRHQPWPMYVPSAMTVWRFASGGAMRGRIDQHHAIRLRRARASPVDSDAVWDDGPSSHERNSSGVRARLRPRCGIVELSRQARHLHRCVPLPVRPFFFIARPHTGHFFALLDGVLTPSSPPPGVHHFPRGEKDMPTRLLVQGRTSIISTT